MVPRDSSRFGNLPGDREHIVKLNANHTEVCKFGNSQNDRDNFDLVRVNIQDLYKKALEAGETLVWQPSLNYSVGRIQTLRSSTNSRTNDEQNQLMSTFCT